ncbi:uncharacterized protein K452DRAFT_287489 [Aplosporella prunicola CBS 121167]|uniref:Uncharacterized protein n=1 Tax=Aplosporella prunicola CBS 121167 TaxID=1176127 RepID=A0A6A6BDK1_9PEZI|nr:uncharacterized protein K452DRAFT_287489 [Aplosporella prunicola CBS 121167]KAF2142269.1 hypothetical protein K452DRAFT_287489 [Aplosporella prunicola CBS 121167]
MALPFDSVAAVSYVYRDRVSCSLNDTLELPDNDLKLYRDVIHTNRVRMRTPKV